MTPEKKLFASVVTMVVFIVCSAFLALLLVHDPADKARRNVEDCRRNPVPARVDGVVRVFMHDESNYTVMTEDPLSHKLQTEDYWRPTIIADAPSDRPMWVDQQANPEMPCRVGRAVIHVHSAKEVNGAGWERHMNKSVQRGTTEVIE